MSLSLQSPHILLLLPLAVLPWLVINTEKVVTWDRFIPHDPLSSVIDRSLKTLGSIVIVSLIVALSGPYLPEHETEQIATGAEFVIMLDRSRSMDEPFAVENSAQKVNRDLTKSKRAAAVRHLTEFMQSRPEERWGFVMFSNKVMPLLPLTQNKQAVLATIKASGLGKGMSETNLAQSLRQAADYFEEQTYRGSRVVLLVSDGGETFPERAQQQISEVFQKHRLSLYWIYLKSIADFSLEETTDEPVSWRELPERKLHQFFSDTPIQYKVFEADNEAEFSQAFLEIHQQQSEKIRVLRTQPKQAKADHFLVIALLALLPLVIVRLYTLYGMRAVSR